MIGSDGQLPEPREAAPSNAAAAAPSDAGDVGRLSVPPTPVLDRTGRGQRVRVLVPAVAAVGLIVLGALGAITADTRPTPRRVDPPPVALASGAPAVPNPDVARRAVHPVRAGMVVRIDAATGDIVDTVTLGGRPAILAEADGTVWVFNVADGTVDRLNASSGQLMASLEFPGGASAILGAGADLWVSAGSSLYRLDARTSAQSARFDLADEALFRTGDAGFMAMAGGSVWVTVPDPADPINPQELWRVDPVTGEVSIRVEVDPNPQPPATLGDAIFTVSPIRRSVTRVDAATNDVTSIRVGSEPVAVAAGDGSIWVGHDRGMLVWRLNPDTLVHEASVDVGAPVRSLAFGAGRLWATTWTAVLQIDPATNMVVDRTPLMAIPMPGGPAGVLPIGDSVWVGIESP